MGNFFSQNCCSDNSNVVTCENVSSIMNSFVPVESYQLNFSDPEIISDLRPLPKLDLDQAVSRKSSVDLVETPGSGGKTKKTFKRSLSNKSRNSFLKKAKLKLFSPISSQSKNFDFGLTFSAACSVYERTYNNYISKPSGDLDADLQDLSMIIDVN